MNADGSGVSRLTDDPADDAVPAWSTASELLIHAGIDLRPTGGAAAFERKGLTLSRVPLSATYSVDE